MTNAVPRILFANPVADMVGGAEVSLLNLASRLSVRGYTPVALLPSRGSLASALSQAGCEVHSGPVYPMMIEQDIVASARNGAQATLNLRALSRLIESLDVDLIHANSYRIGIPLSVIARRSGTPIIWHIRDIPNSGFKKRLLSRVLGLADRVIFISYAVRDAVCHGQQSHCVVIWNGVDIDAFTAPPSETVRWNWGATAETCVFCVVGQLVPWKGQDNVIRAFAQLPNDIDARLVIIGGVTAIPWQSGGGESYDAVLHRLAEELGVAERVRFLGRREDVAELLSSADVYVHASTQPEPFGRTIVEAMAAQLPVIAPSWGGIPEIVHQGATGLLYPPNDVSALAADMHYAACNRSVMAGYGQSGRQVAQERFSIDLHVNNICTLYATLLADRL